MIQNPSSPALLNPYNDPASLHLTTSTFPKAYSEVLALGDVNQSHGGVGAEGGAIGKLVWETGLQLDEDSDSKVLILVQSWILGQKEEGGKVHGGQVSSEPFTRDRREQIDQK